MKKLKKWLIKLSAEWSLRFGICPACDSSGPACDDCKVCNGWRVSTEYVFPTPSHLVQKWRRRFFQAKCIHGRPMEDRCPECSEMMSNLLHCTPRNPRRA